MTWQRARTPKQKAKREQEILDAAAELFLRESYSDITLVKIAQVAGFTRSNVYRYFATKEDIFLQLYQDDLEAFFTHLAQELNALDVPASSAAISDTCATVIMEHPLLLALLPLVTSVLEVNSSEEKLLQLKLELKHHAVGFYEALERLLPGLTMAEGYTLLMYTHALVAGLWSAANPCPVVARVYEHPELVPFKLEFGPLIRNAMEGLIEHLKRTVQARHTEGSGLPSPAEDPTPMDTGPKAEPTSDGDPHTHPPPTQQEKP